jgi:hypothetical protein
VKSEHEPGMNMEIQIQCRLTTIVLAMEQVQQPLAWSDRPLTDELSTVYLDETHDTTFNVE